MAEFPLIALFSFVGPLLMLRGMKRVRIQKKQGVIIITPQQIEDPLLGLGSTPARQSLSADAKKHDQYIYGGR